MLLLPANTYSELSSPSEKSPSSILLSSMMKKSEKAKPQLLSVNLDRQEILSKLFNPVNQERQLLLVLSTYRAQL